MKKKVIIGLMSVAALQFTHPVSAEELTDSSQYYEITDSYAEDTTILPSEDRKENYKNQWVYVEDEGWYYFNSSGNKFSGWLYSGNKWYYLNPENAEHPGLMLESCTYEIGGTIYVFDSDGAMETGWVYTEGEGWYYHAGNGSRQTDWLLDGGKWYYLNSENAEHPGLMLESCAYEIDGITYAFDSNGVMQTGWVYTEGEGWYYHAGNGSRQMDWLLDGGKWYYLNPANEEHPGLMLESCTSEIEGKIYVFDSKGKMETGWVYTEGEGWYYHAGNGSRQTGWLLDGGKWYYLNPKNAEHPGLMLESCTSEIEGKTYVFDDKGKMETGWVYTEGEGWYYHAGNGSRQIGWLLDGGKWYYLNPENEEHPGLMLSSCVSVVEGKTYAFRQNGEMIVGWNYQTGDNEGWYYYNLDGEQVSGWVKSGGKWYYLDPNNYNIMVYDCVREINGQRYVFLHDGDILTGWYFAEGEGWYYYNQDGYLVSGWQLDGGKWYYLDPDNNKIMTTELWKVIRNQWYSFDASGAMRQNWALINNIWYYFGSDGAMRTGWQTINGSRYYFYKENDPNGGSWGAMAANVTIDGIKLGADGSASAAYGYAATVLDSVGWNLRAAYNWSASIPWTATTANPSPGSEWFAIYGFEKKTGNCYVMAATFYYMAKLLGYDAHQVTGYVPTVSGGLTPHSWVEIVINGSTYVFDPDFTNETGRNGYQISYGTSGTWRYTSYSRMN